MELDLIGRPKSSSDESSPAEKPEDAVSGLQDAVSLSLKCHPLDNHPPEIRPSPSGRKWMDATPEGFAYRCLPLTIANSHGWQILNPVAFTAVWDGGIANSSIRITSPTGQKPTAMSHFGSGILTFDLGCIFQTSPGFSLFATGPINDPKDGIGALAGVIETDWSMATFTMNYMFTRANTPVCFEQGEPFVTIFPVERGLLERFTPTIQSIDKYPALKRNFEEWTKSRTQFLTNLTKRDPETVERKWEKTYYKGQLPDGSQGATDHKIKLRLKPFSLS